MTTGTDLPPVFRVSYSADWLAARQESPHLNNIVHPFDWTYTTQYKGQLDLKLDCDVIFSLSRNLQ